MSVTAILLAGGLGSRFGSKIPKQFLPLGNHVVALHSFEKIVACSLVESVVVVCEPRFDSYFPRHPKLAGFAQPGKRRQDSVYQGLQKVPSETTLVLIHDGARPFASMPQYEAVIRAAEREGAACLAIPATSTIREVNASGIAVKRLDRSLLWEMQTPQAVQIDLLRHGFKLAEQRNLSVTDDVALAELSGSPIQIIEGSPRNLKITTQIDLHLAEILLKSSS